jgi:hypothetical protein
MAGSGARQGGRSPLSSDFSCGSCWAGTSVARRDVGDGDPSGWLSFWVYFSKDALWAHVHLLLQFHVPHYHDSGRCISGWIGSLGMTNRAISNTSGLCDSSSCVLLCEQHLANLSLVWLDRVFVASPGGSISLASHMCQILLRVIWYSVSASPASRCPLSYFSQSSLSSKVIWFPLFGAV